MKRNPSSHHDTHGIMDVYVCLSFHDLRGLDTLCSGPKVFHMASELIDFHITFGASDLLGMFMPPGK